jgi:hypothetical protein
LVLNANLAKHFIFATANPAQYPSIFALDSPSQLYKLYNAGNVACTDNPY